MAVKKQLFLHQPTSKVVTALSIFGIAGLYNKQLQPRWLVWENYKQLQLFWRLYSPICVLYFYMNSLIIGQLLNLHICHKTVCLKECHYFQFIIQCRNNEILMFGVGNGLKNCRIRSSWFSCFTFDFAFNLKYALSSLTSLNCKGFQVELSISFFFFWSLEQCKSQLGFAQSLPFCVPLHVRSCRHSQICCVGYFGYIWLSEILL